MSQPDAWAGSWGQAWGVSWGGIEVPPPPEEFTPNQQPHTRHRKGRRILRPLATPHQTVVDLEDEDLALQLLGMI